MLAAGILHRQSGTRAALLRDNRDIALADAQAVLSP